MLAPGTYYIEATSLEAQELGAYTLSVSLLALTGVVPSFGDQGAIISASFSGHGFASPMAIDAGPGINVSKIEVLSPNTATATLSIAQSAPLGLRYITLTTVRGVSNVSPFRVLTTIPIVPLNQTVSGSLAPRDQAALHRPESYGDFYRLVLSAETAVTIDLQSATFDTYVYLLSHDGTQLLVNNQGGGDNNARIRTTLGAGTYFLEATSALPTIGSYTLSVTTASIENIQTIVGP